MYFAYHENPKGSSGIGFKFNHEKLRCVADFNIYKETKIEF